MIKFWSEYKCSKLNYCLFQLNFLVNFSNASFVRYNFASEIVKHVWFSPTTYLYDNQLSSDVIFDSLNVFLDPENHRKDILHAILTCFLRPIYAKICILGAILEKTAAHPQFWQENSENCTLVFWGPLDSNKT